MNRQERGSTSSNQPTNKYFASTDASIQHQELSRLQADAQHHSTLPLGTPPVSPVCAGRSLFQLPSSDETLKNNTSYPFIFSIQNKYQTSEISSNSLNTHYEYAHMGDISRHGFDKFPINSQQTTSTSYKLPPTPPNGLVPPNPLPTNYHQATVNNSLSENDHLNENHPYSRQLSLAERREKARKDSHSLIERRRRERINDKIMQLRDMIPSCADQPQIHKLSILQGAIDYICQLKQELDSCKKQISNQDNDNASLLSEQHPKRMRNNEYQNVGRMIQMNNEDGVTYRQMNGQISETQISYSSPSAFSHTLWERSCPILKGRSPQFQISTNSQSINDPQPPALEPTLPEQNPEIGDEDKASNRCKSMSVQDMLC